MPSSAVQNPPAPTESKSAKKKKAKAERTESPAPTPSPATEKAASASGADATDDGFESPYIRELQKNIRNVNKKITNASKTDPIVDQHKDKTLDELVEAKIINPDQRAQRLKKPQLEAQLAQYEEQLAQYKKVDEEYRARLAAEKTALETTLVEKFEKEKAEAAAQLTEKASADAEKLLHDNLLIVSQFLRLAAARRSEEADATLDENMALEGVLLNVYSGDENAVSTMRKLIEGSSEVTYSVTGEELRTTYAQVKEAAVAYVSPYATVPAAETTETAEESTSAVETDPTVAHAGLTEIDTTGSTAPLTNGHTEPSPQSSFPANAGVSDNAANAAAESEWDNTNNLSASITQDGWVEVPRDPIETETGLSATPAAPNNVQSWADDQPESHADAPASSDANDGFHQVQRNRPRGHDREGSWRGRGRGDHRGGHRGGIHEGRGGRGRGRGRGRGGDMAVRGRPRQEES